MKKLRIFKQIFMVNYEQFDEKNSVRTDGVMLFS